MAKPGPESEKDPMFPNAEDPYEAETRNHNLSMEDIRADVEAGDGFAILQAVAWCGNAARAMPAWLAAAYATRLDRFLRLEIRTLDEAFSVARKKGLNLEAAKKRQAIIGRVDLRFTDLRHEGHSAEAARELVAKEFGISTALAKTYISEVAARFPSPSPDCDCLGCISARKSQNK